MLRLAVAGQHSELHSATRDQMEDLIRAMGQSRTEQIPRHQLVLCLLDFLEKQDPILSES